MKDDNKTKKQLIHDLTELRSQNAALKKSMTGSSSAELAAEEASKYAESIVGTVREPLLVLDRDLKIISANRNFYRTFKVTPGETIGSYIYALGNKQWDIHRLRELLENVLPEKEAFDDFEVDHNFQNIGHKIMLLNAREIYRKDIGAKIILLAIEDITERKKIEAGLEKTRKELEANKISEDAAHEYAESLINTIREPLIALDQDLRVVTVSRSFYDFFKVKPEDTVGQLIYNLGNKQWDIPKLRELLEDILPGKATFDNYEVEHHFSTIGRRVMLLNARQIERVMGKERIILLAIEDITEQKRLENLLTESEERYRHLFETASDGIVLLEKSEGKITHVNPATEKMLGYTRKDSIGNSLQDIGIPIDMEDFQTTLHNLNKRGILNYDNVPVITKSGQHIDTDIYLVDRAKLVQCNIRDITERKHAEEALRKSQEQLREAHRLAHIGVWNWVAETDIVLWTEELYRIAGLDPMLPAPTYAEHPNIYAPESWDLLKEAVERAMKTGEPYQLELKLIRPDSTTRWVNAFGSSTYDRHGRIQGLFGTVQDITERKRAEETLKRSEEKYRTLFEAESDAIIVLDEEKANIIDANEAALKLYGYSYEEITALKAMDLSAEPKKTRITIQVSGKSFVPIRYHRKKDGTVFVVEIASNDFELNGIRTNVSAIRDITERKQVEERLRQSEENFRRSLDDSPMGVRIVTEKGETIYANRTILNFYGYDSIEDLNAIPVEDRYTQESYADFLIRREKRQQGVAVPSEYTINIVRKDGEVSCIQVFRKEILWDGERQFQVLYNDITARKHAEKELSESELRYKALFDNIKSGVAIYDVKDNGNDFIFKDFNKAGERLDGDRKEDIVGKSIYLVRSGIKEFGLLEVFKRVWETGIPEHYPAAFYKDKRLKKWFENCVYKLPTGEIVAVYDDITERKQAEEKLKESEERYRQLFENAPAGIYEIDLTTGRLLSVNDVICKYTGYPRDELLAKNALDLLTEESQKIFIERMAAYAAGKPVPSILEFQARSKSGREFWMSLNVRYIYNAGIPVRATVVAHDITDRKLVEEKLRTSNLQLRALAVRLQQIREYERIMIAREIHDEMGGGLTGLKMDLSWLLRKMGDADPCEERVALMDKIHTSNALIDQMIHVVRRISTDLRPSVLDDLGLIAALEWQLSEFTSRTEIQHEFIKTFDYVYLEVDTSVAVFRIFQEALTNVMRHSRATKVVVVLLEGERNLFGDESLVLEIRDNGRGIIEEEILNKDSLGLLGMKERVLTFGGELSICGEPGGGTALILKIPRKK